MGYVVFFSSILLVCFVTFLYFFWFQDQEQLQKLFSKSGAEAQKKEIPHEYIQYMEQELSSINITHPLLKKLAQETHKNIVGMDGFINAILISLLSKGHLLVEGFPGLAKTKTIQTFADILDLPMKRIQFTPDMLPLDILGGEIFNPKEGVFEIKPGPIFTNIILADEINRTTPKVQSALLEAMQEHQVSLGNTTYPLPNPFFVLATQNPIEQEGTYQLPEAQLDRFLFKVLIHYPTHQQEKEILNKAQETASHIHNILGSQEISDMIKEVSDIHVSDHITTTITRIVEATRKENPLLTYGASPRGSLALLIAAKALAYLQGRTSVNNEDIYHVLLPALRHRIILSYEAQIQNISADEVLKRLIQEI